MYSEIEILLAKEKLMFIKNRSKRKQLDCDLTLKDVLKYHSVTHCELTGIELIAALPTDRTLKHNVRTLDRIDNKKGYVVGNIMVMCYSANKLKAKYEDPSNTKLPNLPIDELLEVVKNTVLKNLPKDKKKPNLPKI